MKTLTLKELQELQEANPDPDVINVLSEEAFRAKHIPGSVNIPLGQEDFVERVEQQLGNKKKRAVVYCASSQCTASPTAARKLQKAGFTNVYAFEGGMKEWEEAGLPVESGEGALS